MTAAESALDEVVSLAKAETARLRRLSEKAGLNREETAQLRELGDLLVKATRAKQSGKPTADGTLAEIAAAMKDDPEVRRVLGLNDGESIDDALAALRAQRRGRKT